MRSLVVGNWKMHGLLADACERARRLGAHASGGMPCDVLICPPSTVLHPVALLLAESGIRLGGQDCHEEESGAYTGDIAAPMLADLGCSHVLLGHSERRRRHGESDRTVRSKAAAAHRAGLVAIVCVGEGGEDRRAGRAAEVVAEQVRNAIPGTASPANTIVAWEPVWAIGTGESATPEDAAAMHGVLKGVLAQCGRTDAMRLLYGGSVNDDNAGELLSIGTVDGLLVGGASLDADRFWRIVEAGTAR